MPCKYPSVSEVSIDRWESALYDEKPVKTVEITQCSTAEPEEVSTTGAEPPSEAMTHRLCKWIFDLVNKLKYCIRKDSADHDVSGKLIVLRTALIIYSTAYICSLVLNKTTFDGKCMGNVDFGYGTLGHPFHSPLGYNACTQNTKTKIIEPNFHIHQNTEGQQVLVWKENERWHDRISEPGSQSLTVLGAVDTNHIRIYGEWFRIFTGIILHAGWFHLLNNALIHFIVLYIIEPEWGFYRTLLGYFVTGCGSYLAGAVFIPCLRQIGSSGVHFGFIGAIAPYCVENWYRMGSPVIVLSLSLLVPLLDLCIKEADIGIQIHLGGYIFGMLYGFSTIKAVTLFDKGVPYYRFTIKFFSRWLKESTRNLYIRKVVKACQIEEMNRIQYENQAKSSTCGFFFMKRLFGVYPLGPYRMRPRDWVTRGISFCLMVILMTFLILMLCFEPLYSSFNPTVSSAFTQTCICCYIKIRNKSALQRLQVLDLAGKYFCFRSKEYANRYCF